MAHSKDWKCRCGCMNNKGNASCARCGFLDDGYFSGEKDEQLKISSNPVLADEGCEINPYLLTGDELQRAEDARKAGRP